jgi:NAD(P)-dependent dehydrogenase (short-subunit alcohol dehydrogenase family)
MPIRLSYVSDQLQEVTGDELLCPEKAALIGPCRVVPLEYPNISCRSIDLSRSSSGDIDLLLAELVADSADDFVAYRNGYRWTPSQQRSALAAVDGESARLRPKGVYLISGGLGGIGLSLAGFLAENYQARLVLTSRQGLPERENWDALLASDSRETKQAARIEAVRRLEDLGAEVMVETADVCDRDQMSKLVERARERFGAIEGVVHAAGIAGGGVIQLTTADAARRVIAPKVQGARNLVELLRDDPPRFMVFCSSVNALYGAPGQVDYSSANAFLDALACSLRREHGSFTVSINWDTWREVGMAVDTEVPAAWAEQRRASLASAISPEEGVQAFERILCSRWPRVLVTPRPVQAQVSQLQNRRQDSESVAVEGAHDRPDLDSDYVASRDELERHIASIWGDLLGLDRVGIHDDFLELGGHSLLATQLLARLRRELGVDWALDAVFKSPTVAEQAALVRQTRSERDSISQHAKRIKELSDSERKILLEKARQARGGLK